MLCRPTRRVCILKSPLVSQPLTESELFDVAYDRGSKIFFAPRGENQSWLRRLTEAATALPPDELLALILNRSQKDISVRLGPEALEASAAMLDMALWFSS